jgi:hypothetical protein
MNSKTKKIAFMNCSIGRNLKVSFYKKPTGGSLRPPPPSEKPIFVEKMIFEINIQGYHLRSRLSIFIENFSILKGFEEKY